MDTGTLRAKVHIDEALRYLGVDSGGEHAGSANPGAEPDAIREQIRRAAEQVENACRPRFIHRFFELEHSGEEVTCVSDNGSRFVLPGRNIAEVLRESGRCIIMAATIGGEVDRLIRRLSVTDMAGAVMADACASSAIEDFCGSIYKIFRRKAADSGAFLTDRYSPGYGDMDISFQRRIADLLQTGKRIGLTVSETFMMTPMKSVTAVIGIADRPQPKKISGCEFCDMKDSCRFRKAGTNCSE